MTELEAKALEWGCVHNLRLAEKMLDLEKRLAAIENPATPSPAWIPVAEKMPEWGQFVWTWDGSRTGTIVYGGETLNLGSDSVTHWHPMVAPKPPTATPSPSSRQWMTVDDYGWEGEATEVFDSLDAATAYYDKLIADAKAHGATETIYLCEVIKSEAVNPGN